HPNRSCRRRRWSSCLRRRWSRGSWVTVARRLLYFQGRSPSLVHHWSSSLLRARLPSLVVFSPS
ncbi:hypothetical protein S245_053336, partial [Arachis hypogaea]